MKLNLSKVKDFSGVEERFSYTLALPDLEIGGQRPITEPVTIQGSVKNTAGLLTLTGELSASLSLFCDRCAIDFKREKTVSVTCALAQSVEHEDSDDIFVYSGDSLELDDVFLPALLLDMDMKILCDPDCQGLCPRCGHDLNDSPCNCKPEGDARWAALKDLLM